MKLSGSEEKFKSLPMYPGRFYDPKPGKATKKHRCADCNFCQECSPSRCNVCRDKDGRPDGKLSIQEQIALFERINAET